MFLQKKHISIEKACFFGGGLSLHRRHVSTEKAHFYGGGVQVLLRRRSVSTEQAYFCIGTSISYGRTIFLNLSLVIANFSFKTCTTKELACCLIDHT